MLGRLAAYPRCSADPGEQHAKREEAEVLSEFLGVMALFGWTAVVAACGLCSAVILWRMVDEVNIHLPEADRFSLPGWHALKYARLVDEYRRLYPSGRRITQLGWAWLGMVASMVIGAIALGLGVAGAAFVGIGGCAIGWASFRTRDTSRSGRRAANGGRRTSG